jgi:hypothetical protein
MANRENINEIHRYSDNTNVSIDQLRIEANHKKDRADYAIKKGKQLELKVRKATYRDTSSDFSERYESKVTGVSSAVMNDLVSYYGKIGSKSEYVCVQTKVKTADSNYAIYKNYFNVKEGVILGAVNYKDLDELSEGGGLPDVLPNSEIFWNQCRLAASIKGGFSSDFNLKKIVGYRVGNEQTKNVALLYGEVGKAKIFYKGSDEYYAFLGTPAVNGKVFLLDQHKDVFGNKEIKAIECKLIKEEDEINLGYLVYHLGDKSSSSK